jgi:spore maturation protein A/spore maturation protein B
MGLRAMQEMQSLNERKDTATDAMIMFLVLNSSGLCLIPISIMMYRAQGGASNPTDVFLPILIATAIATLVGLIALCIRQRIRMDKVIWTWLGGIGAAVALVTWFFSSLPADKVQVYSTFAANFILFCVIIAFIGAGVRRRLKVYDLFIEGAKEGFKTAVMIIPYLVAILVAIGMFRASGALDIFTGWVEALVGWLGFDTRWVGALPTMLMKPLSGSGSCAMMLDVMNANGADAFVSRLAAAVRGSTDTTFYILAVYFGSVGVSKTRYAAGYALLADLTGAVAAVAVAYIFWG